MNRRPARRLVVPLAVVLSLLAGAGWAYWSAGTVAGGNGSATASSVNQGATPTATASGRTVTVGWSATTLSNGTPASGYTVSRYDAATLAPQAVLGGCAGTLSGTTCTETGVPSGQWVYSVTPQIAANWRGPESVRSNPVTVAPPTLSFATSTVRPTTSLTGTAAGFLAGDTVRYRLDGAAGAELTGTLAGSATPAAVPGGGGGAVSVTIPSGTSEGAHTVVAVASPSGETATAGITVDSTAPPAPVLTITPSAVSGDAVTFAYTEAEAGATVECRLDSAAFAACDSPTSYAGLTAGAHTFQARATDPVGNVSPATTYSWTVNLTIPTVDVTFPTTDGVYSDAGFTGGCATATAGDVCGTADDDLAVTAVSVSLRRNSTGQYWNGTSFSASSETFLAATGTTDWSYPLSSGSLPEGELTLRARVSDGANLGYDTRIFTVDRTAPATPVLTGHPTATSGPSATFSFTDADATAGFECRLDGGAYTACTSPRTYTGLTTGSHTVNVRAVDGAGNTSSPTATTWTVDATPPTAGMAFPTTASYNQNGWNAGCGTTSTGDLCGSASDLGSGLSEVAVSIQRNSTSTYWNGTSFAAASETWLTATGTTTWSYLIAGSSFPADGTYTVRWRATDTVGNATTGGVVITVDTSAPPTPTIVQAPTNPSGSSAQLDFTDTEAGVGFQCRLDSGTYAACAGPVSYTGLTAGTHTFDVRAIDAAGNTSPAASSTWTVDTSVPSVSLTAPTAGRSYNNAAFAALCGTPAEDVCGTAADPQGNLSAVAVSIQRTSTSLFWDGSSFASATEIFLPATGTSSWTYGIAAAAFPAEGDYTARARATDAVGLTGFGSVTFTIDRTAPAAPTITSGPSGTTAGGDAFAFTGESGATFECRLDTGAWAVCTSPQTYGVLPDGSHTFAVRSVDRAGNTGAATSRTWSVDATAPSITTTFPAAGGRYTNTRYTAGCVAGTGDVCGTTTDTGSGVDRVEVSVQRASTGLWLSGTSFSAASQTWATATGTASWSYGIAAATFPADDTYTLVVRATDLVGNSTTRSTVFVIDRTRPTAVGFSTTNISTLRKLETKDTFTLTFSEAMDPGSLVSGWDGLTAQNVVVRASNANRDRLTVYNATNTTLLPLGTVNLRRNDWVSAAMTFGLTGTPSTITMSGSSITITLGTPSATTTVAAAAVNMTWTPSGTALDLAGNAAATTAYTEADLDSDF